MGILLSRKSKCPETCSRTCLSDGFPRLQPWRRGPSCTSTPAQELPVGYRSSSAPVMSGNTYRPGWVLAAHSGPGGPDRQTAGHTAGRLKVRGPSWGGTISTGAVSALAGTHREPVPSPRGRILSLQLCSILPTRCTSITSKRCFLWSYIGIEK